MIKSLVYVFLLIALSARAQCPPIEAKAVSIVFVGNSITRHPPKPEIGWENDWGMAAEKQSSDYVANVRAHFARTFDSVRVATVSIVGFEQGITDRYSLLRKVSDNRPQIIVVQGGDNIDKSPAGKSRFVQEYGQLLMGLRQEYGACVPVVCVGPWFSAGTDDLQHQACRAIGAKFVSLRGAYDDPSMHAEKSYPNAVRGVRAHPNDKGMKFISDSIIEALGAK